MNKNKIIKRKKAVKNKQEEVKGFENYHSILALITPDMPIEERYEVEEHSFTLESGEVVTFMDVKPIESKEEWTARVEEKIRIDKEAKRKEIEEKHRMEKKREIFRKTVKYRNPPRRKYKSYVSENSFS